ncbi:MAG: long-chain fatty acid--CoA ligase [Armatimonadetes bacterium]|nr:long-chain fatty acid--CoA ligase [Armatimonadota bacterium]
MLLIDIIKAGERNRADHPAIIYLDHPISYREFAQSVWRCADALRAADVQPGDCVALLLPNCPEVVIAYYAITAMGAVAVPSNPMLKPPELAYIWGDAKVKGVFTAKPLVSNVEAALAARNQQPAFIVSVGAEPPGHSAIPWHQWLADKDDSKQPDNAVHESDIAVCIYTSGTTGRPKGALLTHRNLIVNCRQITQALSFTETDNFMCVLPLFHSFAATVCQNLPLFLGGTMTLLDSFLPSRAMEAVEKHRITIFCGVPAMYAAFLNFPPDREYDLSSLRMCVSGGAPMTAGIMSAFEARLGKPILEGDGPTECSPVTSVNPLHGIRKVGSVGLPVPGVQIKIFDDNDVELPAGEIGEIVVRGENVMRGYLNQPEETAAAMRNGWYHTGDLGRFDEDGYLYIVDRKKDMVIVSGLNVYPREVEEVLSSHPMVADVAVVGMPDALRGERVVAAVVLRAGQTVTARELERFCRKQLANYKVPREIIFRDSLPRSATGKVQKRLLVKELELTGAVVETAHPTH